MSPSTPASRYEAVTDILGGANTADVAKEHGVQESTVDRWVRENSEASEALDPRAREEHQAVREQNEAKPTTGDGRDNVRGAEEEVAPVATDADDVLTQTARARIDELERTLEDLALGVCDAENDSQREQLDAELARADAERTKLFGLCDPEGESPEENDPGVAPPADSSVPFLARDANNPYPSSHGSLSATVNDPNY